ncbi:hypothetical protein CQA53_10030 [Helicobacter didelphidarum]|uniref:Uncharacterized protein n=1 Tax=Helicobacter didelphidarum TaxID=2040648 RepID=A0A3D8I8M4_9HELI|nr:hypothetical protein [Helicobacter didelphidarum]RDU61513.1 hypothetical protein CQA53_10030 [Helicobacter didelphidarum]
MKQDLISLILECDVNEIYKQVNDIKDIDKIVLFSKNKTMLIDNDSCNNLYNKIRYSMFKKSDNAIAYLMDTFNQQVLFNDFFLKNNKEYYAGLLNIEDRGEATQINNTIYIQADKNTLREYFKVAFLQSQESNWNTFIKVIKQQFPKAKNLNDILQNIDKDTLSKILQSFEKSLLVSIENTQDSQYFTDNILPLAKDSIKGILQDLSSNIEKIQNTQYIRKFFRTLAIVLVNTIDFDTKDIFKSLIKKPSTAIYSTYTGINELADTDNEIAYHYAMSLPLIELFVSQIVPMVNLCKKHLMNELLFYDDKFIDFSIYDDMMKAKLPIQSTFLKGKIDSNFINTLPAIFKEGIGYQNMNSEYSIISINDKKYNLEKHISNNIKNLRLFFFAEYKDLNSAKFIEIMKDKALQEQNASSYKEKGYLFITEAPSMLNAGLTKDIMSVIGLTPQSFKTHKRQQEALNKTHNPNIDYSNYIIKQDNNKFKHIVLQLSPFIKLPDDLAKDYKDYTASYSVVKWVGELWNKSLSQQFKYIDTFFQTPDNIEEIADKEEEFAKEFLELVQEFFDKINKDKAYTTKQLKGEIIEEKTEYSPQDVLSIVTTLCILKNEFDTKTPFFGVASRQQKFFESFMSKIRWYQSYIIPNYHSLYVFVKNAYINIDDKKIYLAVSKEAEKELKAKQDILRIYEMLDNICNIKTENEEEFYADIFKKLKENAKTLEVKDEDIEKLEQEEQKVKDELNKKIPSDIEKAIVEKQINKISIQKVIKEGLFSFTPFVSYFDENTDFLGKLIYYFSMCLFDEPVKNKSLPQKFAHILAKELGIFAIMKFDKTINIRQEKQIIQKFYKLIINTRTLYMQQMIFMTQTKTITTINVRDTLRMINKLEIKNLVKDLSKTAVTNMAKGVITAWIKKEFPLYVEELKTKYEYIYYKKMRYKYNLPYTVNRKEFVTIPMKIYNAYMGFDLHTMIYGSKLCTGGLKYHNGIAYTYTPKTSRPNEAITKHYMIKKLLGYILLEELREDDIKFFKNGFNEANLDTLKDKKELYQLRDKEKLQAFKDLDENDEQHKAIDCYNACINILSDIMNDNANTQNDNNYQAKIKELLENLKIIGQNNIRAMYVGTSSRSKGKKRPKFIGRLATTIIMEDGLWIG